MKEKCRLGVLVSGTGTNLQAILDATEAKDYPAEVAIVISNVAGAPALERAKKKGIPTAVIPHALYETRGEFERDIAVQMENHKVDLVILAGFMRVLTPFFIRLFPNRIMNIHPALLPAFPGTHAIERAWKEKLPVTGVTVHFVDEGTDTGPILLQEEVPIEPGISLERLEAKIHEVEHRLYPKAIRLFAEGKLEKPERSH